MFKIGDFSRFSGVSVRMLRHYDKLGLLCPQEVDRYTGFRYYTAGQLARVSKIQHLRQLGFSLALVKEMLSAPGAAEIERYFALRKAEIEEELESVSAQARLLDQAFTVLKGEQSLMEYTVVLKEMPERRVAAVRGVLHSYADEGQLWGKLYENLYKQGVIQAKAALLAAVYHDKEYKEGDVDVEVQTAVEGGHADAGEVRFYTVPKTLAATVTFSGGYSQMAEVSRAAAEWIEAGGYQMDGAMFNLYHVGPPAEPNPDRWVTEACFPVRKQAPGGA